MNLRRLAAVAVALSCAFAAPSSAGGTVALDGVKRVHSTYKGEVTEPAYTITTDRMLFEPSIEDCATPGACDVTAVRLTLPKGSTAGKFKATITMPRELNGAVAMFDAKGNRVGGADMFSGIGSLCCDMPTWQISFVVGRLPAGQYTLVVFDRGGVGEFTADVDYTAHRPDRQRTKS